MRDAQSLLDRLLAFGGERLTADQVREMLGMAGDDRVVALAEAVVAKDAGQASRPCWKRPPKAVCRWANSSIRCWPTGAI